LKAQEEEATRALDRASSSSSVKTPVDCSSSSSSSSSASSSSSLDFESRHGALESETSDSATQFESCGLEFVDLTPCQDPIRAHKFPREKLVYRERHCPKEEEEEAGKNLMCLVPAPLGYKTPFQWPKSRDYAWFANVPHKELTVEKAIQNWIQYEGDRFRFPGGGTMFPRGAGAYIDEIAALIPLSDGSIRTAIDTGCGVSLLFLSLSFFLSFWMSIGLH
jgi:hypothetical protein